MDNLQIQPDIIMATKETREEKDERYHYCSPDPNTVICDLHPDQEKHDARQQEEGIRDTVFGGIKEILHPETQDILYVYDDHHGCFVDHRTGKPMWYKMVVRDSETDKVKAVHPMYVNMQPLLLLPAFDSARIGLARRRMLENHLANMRRKSIDGYRELLTSCTNDRIEKCRHRTKVDIDPEYKIGKEIQYSQKKKSRIITSPQEQSVDVDGKDSDNIKTTYTFDKKKSFLTAAWMFAYFFPPNI